MKAPTCKLCGSDHWSTQPHVGFPNIRKANGHKVQPKGKALVVVEKRGKRK